FYSPATIVKDAQRHGLKVLPVDVMRSEWNCTLEAVSPQPSEAESDKNVRPTPTLRLGLRYVKGLHEEAGQSIARERKRAPFTSIHDLVRRVPELRKNELNTLAEIGALNSTGLQIEDCRFRIERSLDGEKPAIYNRKSEISFHRRDALWSAAAAAN